MRKSEYVGVEREARGAWRAIMKTGEMRDTGEKGVTEKQKGNRDGDRSIEEWSEGGGMHGAE